MEIESFPKKSQDASQPEMILPDGRINPDIHLNRLRAQIEEQNRNLDQSRKEDEDIKSRARERRRTGSSD